MKCLLPVFPADADDRARLVAPLGGGPVFLRAARALAGHPGLAAVLATNDPDIAARAKPFLPVLTMPEAAARDGDAPLPPGTRDCLALLGERGMDPATPLAVCDCRHPFLDGALLDRAKAAWDGRRPLVGVRDPEDHPVQLQAHYLLRHADALVRLDPAGPDVPGLEALARRMVPGARARPEAWLSRPMAMDWVRHGIGNPASGGPYVLLRGDGDRPWTSLVPLAEVPDVSEAAERPFAIAAGFVQATPDSARRLFFFPPDQAPAALSFLGDAAPDWLGLTQNGVTRLFVRTDLWIDGALLKVAPFRALGGLPEAAANLWLGGLADAPRRTWGGREYAAPGATLPEAADGALAALQTPSFDAEATHTEPAFPATCLWDFDPVRRVCVDKENSAPIVGRQLFPGVVQLCPAVALARAGELAVLRRDSPLAGLPLAAPYIHAYDRHLGQYRCLALVERERGQRP